MEGQVESSDAMNLTVNRRKSLGGDHALWCWWLNQSVVGFVQLGLVM